MKIRKSSIFLLIISQAFNFLISAQDIEISGKIVDLETGLPLKGADVYLLESKCGTVSDSSGKFQLNCPEAAPNDTLIAHFLGYKEYRHPLKKFTDRSLIKLQSKSLDLAEIIISAEKIDIIKQDIPHAKNTIRFTEIAQYGSSEISDILKPVPAIRIEGNDLDGKRIQIRGSDADEVKVYIDGILINNVRFDNSADLSIIPVESIERLEILKGGNLAFLGNGAFGGIVNITTRQITEQSFFLKGKLGSSESRYLISEINLLISKQVTISYFGQINSWSPEIEFFPGEQYSGKTRNENISSSKQNHNFTLNYFTRKGQLNTRFIGYFFNYAKPSWESDYNNYLTALSYKGELFGLPDFDINISHLLSQDKVKRNPAGTTQYISSYKTNQLNTRIAKKFLFKSAEIQLLSEYFHDDLLADSKVRDGEQKHKLYHAFLYDNRASVAGVVSFNDFYKDLPILSWKTFLGVRGDFLASGNRDVTSMVGARVDYNREHWKLSPYFNYGKNVKYPTLQENAYIRDITDFSRTDSTTDRLKPEYSNAAELGINFKYLPKKSFYRDLDLSFSLFVRTIYNKLLSRPFDDLIARIQIGRNVTRGFESSIKFNEIFNRFSLNASFVQLDLTNPLIYSYKPKKNFSLHLRYFSTMGLYFASTFFYEGKSLAWYYDTENRLQIEKISPFNDMDISIGFKIPIKRMAVDLQFSGYNIFDSCGFKYYYLKKRNLQVALAIRY